MFAQFLCPIAEMAQSLPPPEDDFVPAMFFVALGFGAVCLVLVGIGVVIGLVCGVICVAGAAVLVALGIVSSSALVAIWQQRFSAGLRALHYQICALAASPGGIFLLWLGNDLFELHLRHRYIVLAGALAGAVAGLLLAAVLYGFGRFACRRLLFALHLSTPFAGRAAENQISA